LDKTPPTRQPLAISQAIQVGLQHHQAGRLREAEAAYSQVLAVDPHNVEVLYFLGTIAHQVGRHESAIELIDKALAVRPNFAEALSNRGAALQALERHEEALASLDKALSLNPQFADALCNRGNSLQALKRYEEALASYDKALSIRPQFAQALCNRGNVLQARKRYGEALASFDKALSLNPDFPDALNNRASVLRALKRHEEALADYDKALAIKPDWVLAHLNRAHVLLELQRKAEAIGAYRKALEHGGNAEHINYELAGLGVGAVPAGAPSAYIADLFDRYADDFDQHLVGGLNYQTPKLLFQQLTRFCRSRDLDVADLGCGTGLLGPLLRPLSSTLTGVDLSANMLKKASERQVYDDLIQSELTKFLETKKDSFDLAIAADVFNYVGDLTGVFAGSRNALRPGGWFSFSVEASDAEDLVLAATGRYRHSLTHCQKLAADQGFVIVHSEPAVLREENGVGVNGYLILMQRP
jgi:predicted TPR repeat methyltransferase/thioredoxin-like negative regulator of GroEL